MRRAARKDDNHNELVAVLEGMGCDVLDLSAVGKGCPDILVAAGPRINILMECKDGEKSPSRRHLTPEQQIFHTAWRGPCHVIETVEEAVKLVNRYRRAQG